MKRLILNDHKDSWQTDRMWLTDRMRPHITMSHQLVLFRRKLILDMLIERCFLCNSNIVQHCSFLYNTTGATHLYTLLVILLTTTAAVTSLVLLYMVCVGFIALSAALWDVVCTPCYSAWSCDSLVVWVLKVSEDGDIVWMLLLQINKGKVNTVY